MLKSRTLPSLSEDNAQMAARRKQYPVEGFKGRVITLFHVTCPDKAKEIAQSGKMIRGVKGMFGGGIYFALSTEIADHKAKNKGAVIEAGVLLGYSLICKKPMKIMTYALLSSRYGCNSVKGDGCVSNPEYVVYNCAQVSIKVIRIEDEIYYEPNNEEPLRMCKNPLCEFNDQQHQGNCKNFCPNPLCSFFRGHHFGRCSLLPIPNKADTHAGDYLLSLKTPALSQSRNSRINRQVKLKQLPELAEFQAMKIAEYLHCYSNH